GHAIPRAASRRGLCVLLWPVRRRSDSQGWSCPPRGGPEKYTTSLLSGLRRKSGRVREHRWSAAQASCSLPESEKRNACIDSSMADFHCQNRSSHVPTAGHSGVYLIVDRKGRGSS